MSSRLTEALLILVVQTSLRGHKVQDPITLAKSKRLVYGAAGNRRGGYLYGELLKQIAKIDATHVLYKGVGPAVFAGHDLQK